MTITQRLKGRRVAGLGLAAILSIAAAGASASAQRSDAPAAGAAATEAPTNEAPESVIESWPKDIQTQARALIERYGKPSASDANALVWFNNGPWRKTVLHREGFTKGVVGKDRDHLEQVISYPVPEEKVADIQKFDKRIEVNRATDEMSSRADTESMNFLALNLADEIVKGERSVQGARVFYRRVKLLEKTGKSSPYLDGLLFTKKDAESKEPMESADPAVPDSDGTLIPDKDRKGMEPPPAYEDAPNR